MLPYVIIFFKLKYIKGQHNDQYPLASSYKLILCHPIGQFPVAAPPMIYQFALLLLVSGSLGKPAAKPAPKPAPKPNPEPSHRIWGFQTFNHDYDALFKMALMNRMAGLNRMAPMNRMAPIDRMTGMVTNGRESYNYFFNFLNNTFERKQI